MRRLLLVVVAAAFVVLAGAPARAQTITERAAAEHEAKCRSGDGAACWVVGRWYRGGIRLPQDRPRAAALLKRSCELGHADGCKELADLQLTEGAGYDPASAIAYFDVRCRGGDKSECLRLAKLYRAGQPGVASDPAKARGFAERACNAGSVEGCRTFAAMAAKGEGGPPDMGAAIRGSERACELNEAVACATVAQLALDGAAPDAARALQFAEKGCGLRNADACTMAVSVAVTRLASPDGARAAKAAESGCALKNAEGCILLAKLHFDGKYLPVDKARAKDATIKACELKSVDGCRAFLSLAETKAEIAVGQNRLCALKQLEACMAFGRMAEEGDGIAQDNFKAMLAYQSALRIDPGHAEAKRRFEIVSKKPVR